MHQDMHGKCWVRVTPAAATGAVASAVRVPVIALTAAHLTWICTMFHQGSELSLSLEYGGVFWGRLW